MTSEPIEGRGLSPDLCRSCNEGDHSKCDFTMRREAGLCGCTSSRHAESGRVLSRPPSVLCLNCGRRETVTPDGRGFPPDIAMRRLAKRCALDECPSEPEYEAGIAFGGPVTGQAS